MAGFTPEWVAALLRNGWPVSSGISGRVGAEYAVYASLESNRIRDQFNKTIAGHNTKVVVDGDLF